MKPNTVIIIGTEHDRHFTDPKFGLDTLIELIQKTEPDVICAELSPEQLDGTTTCNSKPEYPNAIIPYAREHGIPIVPIQPCTSEGLEWGNRKRAELERIQLTEDLKKNWDFWMILSDCIEAVNSPTLKTMQSRAYDTWSEIIWEKLQRKLFPALWDLKEEWNRRFYSRIEETISEFSGCTILVTVGFKHKHRLLDILQERDDIIQRYIEDYI